jgi:hypothetical protein
MGPISKHSGMKTLVTPSTALLNQKLGISPVPRMLTQSETELLRQSKREMVEAYRARKVA